MGKAMDENNNRDMMYSKFYGPVALFPDEDYSYH